MAKTNYRCDNCGAEFHEEVSACPKCGCDTEIWEVEPEYLSDDEVFDLVENGTIANV